MNKTIKYSRILSILFVLALMAWPAEPMAQINHSSADFGDVVIGATGTIVVTITNTGGGDFFFRYSLPENSCGFTASGENNLVLSSARPSAELTLAWSPLEPGQCSAELQVINGRTVAAIIEVTGNAILEQAKIEVPEVPSLVDAFDEWVANGDIMAKGRGKAGAHYIKAYRNLLVKAVHLMERGQARKAYMKLMLAQRLSRQLLKGYAVWDLRQEINSALASLKQEGVRPVDVAQEARPEAGILLNTFDEWVQCGDIKGKNTGKGGARQLQQFRKMLEKASDLMERGRTKQAYFQLMEARKLSWVFLKGDAAGDLREMLNDMLESLKA
jgi:hypothetical protein